MPGNPPPVPTSRISVKSLKLTTLANAKECKMCFSYKLSMSALEITFIWEFHSV